MSNKKILFIFDIDDTLTKTALIHQKAFTESLQELGLMKMNTNFGEYTHHTDSFISKTIYENEMAKPFSPEVKTRFEQLLTNKMKEQHIEEVPGASSFVNSLTSQHEIAYCFATGSLRRPAIQKLQALNISFQNQQLVTSDNMHSREQIIQQAIKNAKTLNAVKAFERIISFGDGLWDLKAADNLKLEFVGVGNRNKEILMREGCQKHIEDFRAYQAENFR